MANRLNDLAHKLHAFVATDNSFQRRARVLQAIWRQEQDLAIGKRPSGEDLGSRIALNDENRFSNLITEHAKLAANHELAAVRQGSNQLIDEDRLLSNLLSSQPLCFNLFAELQADLQLATRIARELWPTRVLEVTAVRFEHSPGRGDFNLTEDRSAFDVFFEHTTLGGGCGFIGVEVKYHESLDVKEATYKERYAEITSAMGCFRPDALDSLKRRPLEQIWRDHLLLGAMLQPPTQWTTGLYVFLYPRDNAPCAQAAEAYRACLSIDETFAPMVLEHLLDAIERHTSADWVRRVRDRYLGWDRLDSAQ